MSYRQLLDCTDLSIDLIQIVCDYGGTDPDDRKRRHINMIFQIKNMYVLQEVRKHAKEILKTRSNKQNLLDELRVLFYR